MFHRFVTKKQKVAYVRRPRQRYKGDVFDRLSVLVLWLILCLVSCFIYIYNFPDSPLNPYPPLTSTLIPTIYIQISQPTNTRTYLSVQPQTIATSQVVEILDANDYSNTVEPTFTLPGLIPPNRKKTETPLPSGYYSYKVINTPVAINASILMPNRDCNWLGLGGNIVDIQNRPATGILVQMGGFLNKPAYIQTSLSGTALQYGPSGFEFTLSDKPINTKPALWIRLVDQTLQPISDKVPFIVYSDCNLNLTLINFKQIK